MNKIQVSKNREAHLLEEIKDNLNEVSKIEKQKEKNYKKEEELKLNNRILLK